MDPIALVAAALLAGVTPGLTTTVQNAIQDTYAALRDKVKERFANRPVGTTALDQLADAPDAWRDTLVAELTAADAATDEVLIELAQRILATTDPRGASTGKYSVAMQNAQGVMIGDKNEQKNYFGGKSD